MSKPSWKYNPAADGGIGLAMQEDTARETHEQRSEDVVFARDYAAVVQALRVHLGGDHCEFTVRLCREVWSGDAALSEYQNYVTFCDLYGFPALLRALARAIEQETRCSTV